MGLSLGKKQIKILNVNDKFEIENGIFGMMRDIMCMIMQKMYWDDDRKIRNVFFFNTN
jgi:hypothetical protein